MKRLIAAAAAVLLMSGCAYNAQKAVLSPTVVVAKSEEGRGTAVGLRVVDERASKSLGHRGTAYGKAAQITTDQDIAAVVQDKVSEGLRNKGYTVVPYAGASTGLSIEVRSLDYSTSQGFWTGGVAVNASMKAVAKKPGDTYERMYRSDKERRVAVVPTAGKNQEDLNDGLSGVLAQLFDDVGLFRFLNNGNAHSANAE